MTRYVLAALLAAWPIVLSAQPPPQAVMQPSPAEHPPLDLMQQLSTLRVAVVALPLATALGAALAFRPRRRGTPPRQAIVIQTQIILAIVGAVVMLVVGQSLARAFGIVGAASLIRYRAKIDNPKDAGVMLCTLALGLASGVGLYALSTFSMLFILGVLWWAESIEPKPVKLFVLKVVAEEPVRLRRGVERVLGRNGASFELRASSATEVSYEVQLPIDRRTDVLSNEILQYGDAKTAVDWEEKKLKS